MRGIAARALIGGFVLFVLVGFGHSLWYEHHVARFDDAIARIRAAGEPTQFSEIANPQVPDDQNAFLVVEQAARMLRRLQEDPTADTWQFGLDRTIDWEDSEGPAPSKKEHAAIAADFKKLGEYFDLLEQVPERRGWYEPDPLGMDGVVALQETFEYVLRRYEFDPGNSPTKRAIRGFELVWTMQDRYEPRGSFGWCVQSMFRRTSAAKTLRMAAHPSIDPARLRAAVDPLLRRNDEDGPPRLVLVNERAYSCELGFLELGRTGGLVFGDPWDRTAWWSRPKSVGRLADMLDDSDSFIRTASTITTAESAWQHAQKLPEWNQELEREDIFAVIVRLDLNCAAETAAAIRLARIAIALRVEERKSGAFPGSLDALAPYFPDGVPTDPFTRATFSYERTEAGVRLKAGKPGATEEDLRWDDLLFELE